MGVFILKINATLNGEICSNPLIDFITDLDFPYPWEIGSSQITIKTPPDIKYIEGFIKCGKDCPPKYFKEYLDNDISN